MEKSTVVLLLVGVALAAYAAENADEFEYAGMPVVNSPRMGICGYEGGTIDTDRDGIYKM